MRNSSPICIIGGYDQLSKSFFIDVRKKNKNAIFINVGKNNIEHDNVYNLEIFQLKKIFDLLFYFDVKNILFLGKISRPNLSELVKDGEIEKYLSILSESFQKGDGNILSTIIKIFLNKGFNIISPSKINKKNFFFDKEDLDNFNSLEDKNDSRKSIQILNALSKYDNAQSIVCINGYIIAIEAVEGTDSLLKRTISVRKKLNQVKIKSGLLTKIPKKKQSKLVDLPVIGPKTIDLVYKANLNGIAINPKYTMVYNKDKVLKLAKLYKLKIYSIKK